MQFFGLLIPIIIGYFADEMFTGVIIGSLFWLVAWSIAKQRQEERLAESATAGDRMQKLEQEIELLKRRLSVLEYEAVRDEAKVGQGLEARAVADVQTASEPLHVRVEPEAEAAPVKQKIEEAFAPSFSIPINPVSAKAAASSEPVVEEVVEAVAPVAAEQAGLPKEEVVVASMPSENEEAPSRQFVIHKDKVEGGEYKFSDNPIVAWFLRGNPLLKTGIVVLFLGLAFLLRYASERVHVPVELRYLTVAGAGLAAVVGGWKLQSRKREYGLVLQGFGVAVMYLTALAALKLHPLLPVSVVFGLMVAMVVLMAWLAVRQNAQIMAQVALIGGMAAPLLTSDGSGNYLVLFSYLALLNGGVAAIAWFKAWRPLNLTGFAATFAIAALWGMRSYTPQHFATTEPFLIYHWLLYTFIAYLFARRKLTENSEDGVTPIADNATLEEIGNSIYTHGLRVHVLDHTLLFGTMAAAYALQYPRVPVASEKPEGNEVYFAQVSGWIILLTALATGSYALYMQWTGEETLFIELWMWPIFAGLLLFAKRLKWEELLQANLAFLPVFALHFVFYHTEHAWTAAAALPLAAATVLNFIILNNYPRPDLLWLHKLNITILGILWTLWTALYVGGLLSGVWTQLSWLVVPLAMWIVFHTQRQRAFFRRHQTIYQHFALPLCALAAACWMLWTNFSTPFQPSPLPYIPVLNPLELASAGMLWFALKSLPEALPPDLRRTTATTVSALAFMLISAGVMRVWHFYDGITWRLDIMLQSFGLQASLSVVWAVTAIILMVLGNRRKQRSYWMTGATLMGIVVVKLFLIELSNSGGIARIVSFIIVGLLLLLVGWFAPVPPKAENDGEPKA